MQYIYNKDPFTDDLHEFKHVVKVTTNEEAEKLFDTSGQLKSTVESWLNKNVGHGDWDKIYNNTVFIFKTKHDADLFINKWQYT